MAQIYTAGNYHTQLKKLLQYLAEEGIATAKIELDHLVYFCVREIRKENASSGLAPNISAIKYATLYSRQGYHWGVTEKEEEYLRSILIPALQKHAPHVVEGAHPISKEELGLMYRVLKPMLKANNEWAAQMWSILTLSYAAITRLRELLEGNLQRRHVTIKCDSTGTPEKIALVIELRKTAKVKYKKEDITTYAHARQDFLCPVKAFLRWAAITGDLAFLPNDTRPVFGRLMLNSHGQITRRQDTYHRNAFVQDWRRRVLQPAGIAPMDLAGHGLRSGGAVNHALEGVSIPLLMRMGLWTREASVHNYIRPDDARIMAWFKANRQTKGKDSKQ